MVNFLIIILECSQYYDENDEVIVIVINQHKVIIYSNRWVLNVLKFVVPLGSNVGFGKK